MMKKTAWLAKCNQMLRASVQSAEGRGSRNCNYETDLMMEDYSRRKRSYREVEDWRTKAIASNQITMNF